MAEFPHTSVALYVLTAVNRLTQVKLVVTSLTKITVGTAPPQLSVAGGGDGAGTLDAHVTVMFVGHVTTGGVTSLTTIVWVHVAELPQTSVALYVRIAVNLLTQVELIVTSLTHMTVGVPPPQLSVAGRFVAGGRTFEAHETVTLAGHVIIGGVTSLTVIVCVHVAEFPHASVAR